MARVDTHVLVVNAGSSSLKLRVLSPDDEVTAGADLPAPRGAADSADIRKAIESFGRVDGLSGTAGHVRQLMEDRRIACRAYTREQGDDAPEIRDWKWTS